MPDKKSARRQKTRQSDPLWIPSAGQVANSNLTLYADWLTENLGTSFESPDDLYQWSVENIESFWKSIWHHAEIIHSVTYRAVLSNPTMPGAKWFEGARLNFAENQLKYRDDQTAVFFRNERGVNGEITYGQLYDKVAACAHGLKALGVKANDRVAAFLPNGPEALIGMLATTSLGAIWSSCSPDFGLDGLLNRFEQISPKVLFATNGYYYNGQPYSTTFTMEELCKRIPSIRKVVMVQGLNDYIPSGNKFTSLDQLMSEQPSVILFEQLPFDHPVYIMYSSGTTGVPKGIVHGAGGTLLQHYKEHHLHCNLTRDDVIFYYTTCGWMMWNWLVSALQVGATIVLYDGSPTWPNKGSLWQMAAEIGVTVFGTSPRFLSMCEQARLTPGQDHDLSRLRLILSTGATLSADNFAYVYERLKPGVQLCSISGGTDILSCFMLGNPNLPVYSEQIQCRGLGMAVEVFNDHGKRVRGEIGELVCTKPFPSMPVKFWNDPDGSKYKSAYFETFPGVWRHGDYVKLTKQGGVIVYGRSDATLNPGGVRIGTSEIYGPLECLSEISESIVVSQEWNNDTRIVLFVVMSDGRNLSDDLKSKIRLTISDRASPRHVPARIVAVDDIPRTLSGKKVELAVQKAIHGREISNRAALANPESLEQFVNRPELKQ